MRKYSHIKKRVLIAGIILALGAVAATIYLKTHRNAKADYKVVRVERGNLKATVATTGTVKPQNRVEIKPPISGRIEEVLIEEGAKVQKGQILALMSSTERAALLDAARAKGKDEFSRWELLYKPMPVVAPINGDIIARNVEPGQTVAANEKIVVMSDRLIVQAQIDETDIGRAKLGQTAELTLDAYPAEVITGKVDAIAYEAQIVNNVTMYMVDILPSHVPPFMRSGMTANIQVITAMTNNSLLLPAEAVHYEGKEATVWRPDPTNRTKPLNVKVGTGLTDGKRVEIISGLNEGDKVFTIPVNMPASKQAAVNPFNPFRRR